MTKEKFIIKLNSNSKNNSYYLSCFIKNIYDKKTKKNNYYDWISTNTFSNSKKFINSNAIFSSKEKAQEVIDHFNEIAILNLEIVNYP